MKNTGVFSDMHYNREGGDVLGTEIFVLYSGQGYVAVYQSSEGVPSRPVVLPAEISGALIRFTVPADIDARGTFAGKITEKAIGRDVFRQS